jgi:hypothetical protein
MPQHSARTTYSRWRWLPAVAAVLVLGPLALVLVTTAGTRPAPGSAGTGCPTLRVVVASSFVSVLRAVVPSVAAGPACGHVAITAADGRAAAGRAASLNADVWIPDDGAWASQPGALELARAPELGAGSVLATTPLYFATDPATSRRIATAGGGWRALTDLVTASRSDVRLVAHEPGDTGDGLLALGGVGEAVWLDDGMDASADALSAVVPRTHLVGVDESATPTKPGDVGLLTERELLADPEHTAGYTVTAPTDHTAELRYSWFPSAAAAADPERAKALEALRAALGATTTDRALAQAGLRRPGGGPPPEPLRRGLPSVGAQPFDVLSAHHLDHVFATTYPEDRRGDLVVAVDVSGSMWARVPPAGQPLIDVVRRGVGSLAQLLPDDSRLALWEFGTHLDGANDYRILRGSTGLGADGRRAVDAAIAQLTPTDTGTGLHDTILAAYRSAQQAYRPGTPATAVVFTDGRNEADNPTISLDQLKSALAAAADPSRPVSLAVISFGHEPDTVALQAALDPVQGYVDRLSTSGDVGAAFIHVAAGGLHE